MARVDCGESREFRRPAIVALYGAPLCPAGHLPHVAGLSGENLCTTQTSLCSRFRNLRWARRPLFLPASRSRCGRKSTDWGPKLEKCNRCESSMALFATEKLSPDSPAHVGEIGSSSAGSSLHRRRLAKVGATSDLPGGDVRQERGGREGTQACRFQAYRNKTIPISKLKPVPESASEPPSSKAWPRRHRPVLSRGECGEGRLARAA
ncbi:hypothetical protein ABID26_000201 [Mesorhizobium shonense]|uniref:Uncharacterized protein n=1 Tax=Mesorhizobium shonense TaxID=1209948 RepID=A0ABV2HKG8_9HYPH